MAWNPLSLLVTVLLAAGREQELGGWWRDEVVFTPGRGGDGGGGRGGRGGSGGGGGREGSQVGEREAGGGNEDGDPGGGRGGTGGSGSGGSGGDTAHKRKRDDGGGDDGAHQDQRAVLGSGSSSSQRPPVDREKSTAGQDCDGDSLDHHLHLDQSSPSTIRTDFTIRTPPTSAQSHTVRVPSSSPSCSGKRFHSSLIPLLLSKPNAQKSSVISTRSFFSLPV